MEKLQQKKRPANKKCNTEGKSAAGKNYNMKEVQNEKKKKIHKQTTDCPLMDRYTLALSSV